MILQVCFSDLYSSVSKWRLRDEWILLHPRRSLSVPAITISIRDRSLFIPVVGTEEIWVGQSSF